MKKIIAMLLALVMVCGLATTAFADTIGENTDNNEYKSEAVTKAITLKKIYNVVGNNDTALYPDETLTFSVDVPEGVTNPDGTKITVDDLKITSNGEHVISINLPVYEKVGIYEYTITENEGEVQGAVYATETEIDIKVLVTYDYANKKLATEIVLATATTDGKLDTFTNTYNVGTLTVKKEVTGNLADSEVYFDMVVTFNATETIASTITIEGGSNAANPTKIEASEWTNGTATANIKLKAGDTLTFYDIPDGVTYSVVEDSKHLLADGATVNPNSDHDKEYTVTYTNCEGEIETNTTTNAKVDNEKSTSVETGVALDSAPYFLMLAVAVVGMVALVSKKRYEV